MRLKLDCVRAARRMLPDRPPAEKVMKLGADLYLWISNDGRRTRRKLQKRLRSDAMHGLWADVPENKIGRALVLLRREIHRRGDGNRGARGLTRRDPR
jgi:hypothetical protein